MKNFIRNWRFDMAEDCFGNANAFGDLIVSFLGFISCPADCMGLNPSSNLVVVGESFVGGNKITVSGISLISKIADDYTRLKIVGDEKSNKPYAYQVTTTMGEVYYLLDADMNVEFRQRYISRDKIIPFGRIVAL